MRGITNSLLLSSIYLTIALFLGCTETPGSSDSDDILVGALLPFTGDIATSGTNIERALLLAAESVNKAGGIDGRSVRITARDTHSELRRGIDAAKSLLIDDNVQAIIGPQNEELAWQMLPLVREVAAVQISGGVTSSQFSTVNDSGLWFRTCPSGVEYAAALAQRMYSDGVRRAAVVYIGDEYGSGFSSTLINTFADLGIESPAPVSFQPNRPSYADNLRPLVDFRPEAIALVAYPKTGATIVQQSDMLIGKSRWYLSPTLKTRVFIDNVSPGLLQGSVGIAASLAGDANNFAEKFAERWHNELPMDAAYFYYDAAALVFLSMAAVIAEGQELEGPLIAARMVDVAGPGGTQVRWNDLEKGLNLIRAGKDIDYQGVSGPVDLDRDGDLTQSLLEFWTIEKDQIVPLANKFTSRTISKSRRGRITGDCPIASRIH